MIQELFKRLKTCFYVLRHGNKIRQLDMKMVRYEYDNKWRVQCTFMFLDKEMVYLTLVTLNNDSDIHRRY